MTAQHAVATLFLVIACGLASCSDKEPAAGGAAEEAGPVRTGADVLVTSDFEILAGRRVGLIANHTSRSGGSHLADLMSDSPAVDLVALFGPEHGVRGTADAGARVGDSLDATLGIPVYSLYGERRSPDPTVLESLDVLVFDIQDVGARFYTYVSTMGLAMEAAATAEVGFVVLDRPNPLGGEYVSGFVREGEFKSFVGYYPIPVAHGMTVAELARMAQGEGWGDGLEKLRLEVVPMQGWERSMQWMDTGLEWIPTSPNIPNFETALIYPGACFIEGTVASEGRGTLTPFVAFGADWARGVELARSLNAVETPGLTFVPHSFVPQSIPYMSLNPKLLGRHVSGAKYRVDDRRLVQPVETGVAILRVLLDQFNEAGQADDFFRSSAIDRLAGTRRLRELLTANVSTGEIVGSWTDEVSSFTEARLPYLIYD